MGAQSSPPSSGLWKIQKLYRIYIFCQGLDLNLCPLLCLAVSLLAEPPGILDRSLDNSLNDPTLNLVCCEPWTLCSSHKLPLKAMPLYFLFARLLCSLQPITRSCQPCCHPYLRYHLFPTLDLFLNYTSAYPYLQPLITDLWLVHRLHFCLSLLSLTCYQPLACYWQCFCLSLPVIFATGSWLAHLLVGWSWGPWPGTNMVRNPFPASGALVNTS